MSSLPAFKLEKLMNVSAETRFKWDDEIENLKLAHLQ